MRMELFIRRCLWTSCFLVLSVLGTCLQADGPKREFGSIPRVNILSDVFGFGTLFHRVDFGSAFR